MFSQFTALMSGRGKQCVHRVEKLELSAYAHRNPFEFDHATQLQSAKHAPPGPHRGHGAGVVSNVNGQGGKPNRSRSTLHTRDRPSYPTALP